MNEPVSTASLAIIVVSYNVRALLAACLKATQESLAQSGYRLAAAQAERSSAAQRPSATIMVVDNASADGSAHMTAEDFPQVRLIASPENLGFAGGNNLALRELGFGTADTQSLMPDLVLLLNPDAEPQWDAIGQMARCLVEHPKAGGVGAQLQYSDGRFQHGAFRFPGLWQLWFDFFPPRPRRLLDSRLNGRYGQSLYAAGRPFPIDFALGAALMVRHEAIQAAGLLDEGYFMYAEEVDWCWRIQRAGWPLYCVPSARVIHHGGASTRQFRSQSFTNLWRSRKRLYGRFYGPQRRWLAAQIVRLGMCAEARRARIAAARGEIDQGELAARLTSVREVLEFFRAGQSYVTTGRHHPHQE